MKNILKIILITSFTILSYSSFSQKNYNELREITIQEIEDKNILLSNNASTSDSFGLHFINGTSQVIGIDFFLQSDNIIAWENMGLDGFIEAGDLIKLEYY